MTTRSPPQSVDELCQYSDREFLELAYQALLGREPDASGEAHFLHELRAGLSKLSVLSALRMSAEGQRRVPELAGLDRALRRYRQANRPYSGWLVRLMTGLEGNSRQEKQARATANQVAALLAQIDPAEKRLSHGVQRLTLRGEPAESDDRASSIAAQEKLDQLRLRLVRIEGSVKRLEARLDSGGTRRSAIPMR